MAELEKEMVELKKLLAQKDAQIAELTATGAPQEKVKFTKAEESIMAEAMKAYGIDEKFVIGKNVRGDTAVIVTNGGAKVRYRKGDKVTPLEAVQIDGIIRKKMKAITGGGKKSSHAAP